MTLDNGKIQKNILFLRDNIIKLNELSKVTEDDFKLDFRNYNSALRLLQISIESIIDIGNHIISRRGFDPPVTYSDVFEILRKNNIISAECMDKCINMVKFRNRIVHIYFEIDLNMVLKLMKEDLGDFEVFISEISGLLAE